MEVDVDALVEDIRATVAAKRAAGEYPQALLDDLERDFDVAAVSDPPEMLSLIQTARPLQGGRVVRTAKKVTRRLLAWYVRPTADDQTRFNDAITRELRSLERRVEAMESNYQATLAAHLPSAESLAGALKKSLQSRKGPVLLVGSDLRLGDIASQLVAFDASKPRIGDRLNRLSSEAFAAVVLDGVLQRISSREIGALLKTAKRVLMPSGLVLVAGPDPEDADRPNDPSGIDISMQRWLSCDTVEALLNASGFQSIGHSIIDANPRWYLAVASRPE
jgi:hypothetical protein